MNEMSKPLDRRVSRDARPPDRRGRRQERHHRQGQADALSGRVPRAVDRTYAGGAAAGLDQGGLGAAQDRQRDLDRDHPAGRQHRPGRRTNPAQRRDRAVAQPHGQDPRGRSGLQHHHLRGRRHLAARPRGRGQRRPALSAAAAVGGKLHHRRQSLDQRRRHRGARLRHRALARARPRSGAGGRPRAQQSQQAQEGQHRLRPQEPVHRRRRHARRHHRGGAAAGAAAEIGRDRMGGDPVGAGRGRSARASPPSSPPAA